MGSRALDMCAWVIVLTGASSAVMLALAIHQRTHPALRRALRSLRALGQRGERRRMSAFEAIGGTALGSRLARRLSSSRSLARRLALAGSPWSFEGVAGRALIAAVATTGFVIVAGMVTSAGILLVAPVAVVCGFRVPSIVLARRGRHRQQRIESQVPELVELLVAGSESGLPPPTAFIRSAEILHPPLGEELARAASRIRLGMQWRAALDETVARTDASSLSRLARALERSHRLGASIQGSLRALVDDVRAQRRARAEEKARRAPVKMLFPLVFLILPAFLLLTVGPVLLSTVRSLH